MSTRADGYWISDDPSRLDRDAIHAYLSEDSYWARGRSRASLERALEHSLAIGIYDAGGAQAAFSRVVTDRATFAWLCDVFVLGAHRGRGLGVWLVEATLAHPDVRGVERWWLATADAHGLYSRFGFAPHPAPEYVMLWRPSGEDPGPDD